MLKIQIMCR